MGNPARSRVRLTSANPENEKCLQIGNVKGSNTLTGCHRTRSMQKAGGWGGVPVGNRRRSSRNPVSKRRARYYGTPERGKCAVKHKCERKAAGQPRRGFPRRRGWSCPAMRLTDRWMPPGRAELSKPGGEKLKREICPLVAGELLVEDQEPKGDPVGKKVKARGNR